MNAYQRPLTFQEDQEYLWLDKDEGNQVQDTRVIFVTYAPCPAFVIVRKEDGKFFRCSRDDLFVLAKNAHSRR